MSSSSEESHARGALFGGVPAHPYGGPTLGASHQGALLRGGEHGEDAYDALATPDLKQGTADRRGDSMLLATELADSLLGQVAEQARAAARAQGYSVGWAEGRRAAAAEAAQVAQDIAELNAETEAHRAQEHEAAVAGLVKAANEVRSLLQSLATRIEGQASGLAWELTAALMDREVAVAESSDVVRRVLKVLPDAGLATVRLHPSVVTDHAVAQLREAGVTLVADPSLSRVDALVETDGSIADLRISEATERVRQVLS
ncbi:MAG: FliH/SctL family protein [Nocardioides sp.]